MSRETDSILKNILKASSMDVDDAVYFKGHKRDHLTKVFKLDPDVEITVDQLERHSRDFKGLESDCRKILEERESGHHSIDLSVEINNFVMNFLELGKSISKTEEIQEFQNLVKNIYSENILSNNFPFVFICASSGTGKTQIPFSLECDFPYIYFLQNFRSNRIQDIYQPFLGISECFDLNIRTDLDAYDSIYHRNSDKKIMYQCFEIKQYTALKFYSVGFIVEIFKHMCKKRDSSVDKSLNWIYFELQTFKFDFAPMTISEGIAALSKIKDDSNLRTLPIIFLDESCVTGEEIELFQFRRNVLRLLRLVVVFMGTDAAAGNFVRGNCHEISRGVPAAWCYIIYKLAPTSPAYLERKKREILTVFRSCDDTFIDMLFDLMKNERPLFAKYIIDALLFADLVQNYKKSEELISENFPSSMLNSKIIPTDLLTYPTDQRTLLPYFCSLLVYMFKRFQLEKMNLETEIEFSNGQLTYLITGHRKFSNIIIDMTEMEKRKKEKIIAQIQKMEEQVRNPINIHRHIAYLEIPDNFKSKIQKSYVVVRSSMNLKEAENTLYLQNNSGHDQSYALSCCFPSFFESPLTGLAFSGLPDNFQHFLIFGGKRIYNDTNLPSYKQFRSKN